MDPSFALPERVIKALHSVFERHQSIQNVILYGSRAKGTHRLGSDIDITIVGERLTLRDIFAIEQEIDDCNLPYIIDCSLYSQISNEKLLNHINRVGIVLYAKPESISP